MKPLKIFEHLFLRVWWVLLFLISCLFFYEYGLRGYQQEYEKLHDHYIALLKEKDHALQRREGLVRQINSQSDPNWVELILMKDLGLVPEGQIKVLFSSDNLNFH